MAKLSETQQRALGKLHEHLYYSAYELQESIRTLDSLCNKGLAEKKLERGAVAFPRTGTTYRLAPNISDER